MCAHSPLTGYKSPCHASIQSPALSTSFFMKQNQEIRHLSVSICEFCPRPVTGFTSKSLLTSLLPCCYSLTFHTWLWHWHERHAHIHTWLSVDLHIHKIAFKELQKSQKTICLYRGPSLKSFNRIKSSVPNLLKYLKYNKINDATKCTLTWFEIKIDVFLYICRLSFNYVL